MEVATTNKEFSDGPDIVATAGEMKALRSVGFVSSFLSAQRAKSMPSRLLTGLQWAQAHMGAAVHADSAFLAPYKARYHGGGHATTWSVLVCAKFAVLAAHRCIA